MSYHDSYCGVIADDSHTPIRNLPMYSQPLTDETIEAADLVLVVTDHSTVDYQRVADKATLVVDTRGIMRSFSGRARIIGLSGSQAPLAGKGESGPRRAAPAPVHAV